MAIFDGVGYLKFIFLIVTFEIFYFMNSIIIAEVNALTYPLQVLFIMIGSGFFMLLQQI